MEELAPLTQENRSPLLCLQGESSGPVPITPTHAEGGTAARVATTKNLDFIRIRTWAWAPQITTHTPLVYGEGN